jgi:hypothetical protein
MKKSLYKYLCLLLMTICCLQVQAHQNDSNDAAHVLRVGLAGGGGLNLTPADCVLKGNIGGCGALTFDYVYYKSLRQLDLGLRTGLDFGYLNSPYQAQFEQQYNNIDYLGNQMDYTTSGDIHISQHQLYASIPLMFALRSNEFVWNIGVRLQTALYQSGKQKLSNPQIHAYYPRYDVTVTNELITGVVAEEQLSMPLELPSISLECLAAMEIGYEHQIYRTKNAIGILAYFNVGVWNSLPKATANPIIQVAPITDMNHPVPEVKVNDAYHSLLTSYIPMQFGVKLYYAFTL